MIKTYSEWKRMNEQFEDDFLYDLGIEDSLTLDSIKAKLPEWKEEELILDYYDLSNSREIQVNLYDSQYEHDKFGVQIRILFDESGKIEKIEDFIYYDGGDIEDQVIWKLIRKIETESDLLDLFADPKFKHEEYWESYPDYNMNDYN